jgi:hypothetical protein
MSMLRATGIDAKVKPSTAVRMGAALETARGRIVIA